MLLEEGFALGACLAICICAGLESGGLTGYTLFLCCAFGESIHHPGALGVAAAAAAHAWADQCCNKLQLQHRRLL